MHDDLHDDELRQFRKSFQKFVQTELVRALLIKVTEFFRDPELFRYLREQVLPELIEEAHQRGGELRLWSAGCATGEEAYSLAILVAELLEKREDSLTVRIFATDLDEGDAHEPAPRLGEGREPARVRRAEKARLARGAAARDRRHRDVEAVEQERCTGEPAASCSICTCARGGEADGDTNRARTRSADGRAG